jgi:hypothetical protein
MRRRIVISAVSIVIIATLLACIGHFGLRWWQPLHETIVQTTGGFDANSESTTLQEVLTTAHESLDRLLHNVQDYSGVIIKTERIGGKPITTVLFAKIREKPFSVYLYFLDRSNDKGVKGREVVYLQGKNDDKLIGHSPGLLTGRIRLSLAPTNPLATLGEHYPITEIGLANLCRQLIRRGEAVADPSRVQVKRFPEARINDRSCTLIQVMYPVDEPRLWGYLARVFLDKQWGFPIRVEIFELPADRSQGPQLLEEYTYLNLKLNNGYTDADFDPKNRQYKFP